MLEASETRAAAKQFGARLRALRVGLGLSQSDLAEDGVSASYVSLLESGKRTATPATIAALARKLDCAESFLVSGHDPEDVERLDLSLKFADLALRNGEGKEALKHATAALESGSSAPAEMLWRARRLRAQALEAVGEVEQAILELEKLHAEVVATHRWQDALPLTVALARCYTEAGDVSHALTLVQHGLAQANEYELIGSDVHAELAAMVIGLHYLQGDHARADLLADDLLAQLEGSGSRRARGSVYWNASLNAEARGDVRKGIVLAERALALFAEGDDERALARLRTAYAWLLLRSAPPRAEQAQTLLKEAHRVLSDTGSEVDLAYCETELGRASLLLGEPRAALKHAKAALRRLGPTPRHQTAHARLVVARSLLALGQQAEAVAEYRAAAAMLTDSGVGRQAAAAWRELADAFTGLHLFEDAAPAYQQALLDVGVGPAPDVAYPGTAPTRKSQRKVVRSST